MLWHVPLQLCCPDGQAHTEFWQVIPPVHTLPHPPQFIESLVVLISQPLPGFPSQSTKPVLQALIAHADALQTAVAFCKTHLFPQLMQLATSLVVLTSQPSPAILLQSAYPAAQDAMAHIDDVHVAVALFNAHTWPQVMQLLTSFVVFAQ